MRGRATKTTIAAFLVLCCVHCSKGGNRPGAPSTSPPPRAVPVAKTSKPVAPVAPAAKTSTRRLFVLRVDQPRDRCRTYVSIARAGSEVTIEQVNTFASTDKDAAAYTAARSRASRTLELQSGDAVLRTAAFSELAFRRPNHVRFIGSMQLADSVTRISGRKKIQLASSTGGPAALSTTGKLHIFLYLESSKGGALYSFALDVASGRVGEVARDDVATFRRVNAFHAKRLTGKLAAVKNLYLELLSKLPASR